MKTLCRISIITLLLFFNGKLFADEVNGYFPDADVKNIYIASSFRPNVDKLEQTFKARVNMDKGVIFTKVPRGLVISFDEKIFFNKGDARIKEHSLYILDVLAQGLKNIPNDCVVEDHTSEEVTSYSDYNTDWELSIARAGNITQYLINCGNIDSKRMFALGYGEFMPFKDNVSAQNGIDNRIDIVILEYEARR